MIDRTLLALALALPVTVLLDLRFPGRPVLATVFFVALPGLPLARLLRLPDRLATLVLAVGTSMAVHLLLANALLVIGQNGALAGTVVPGVLSVAMILVRRKVGHTVRSPTPPRLGIIAWVTPIGLMAAAVLFLWAVLITDPASMSAHGLMSIIPLPFVAALAVAAGLAAFELTRERVHIGRMAGVIVLWIGLLFGFPSAVERAASQPVAWTIARFTDFVARHDAALQDYDARFSWPAFLAAGANLTGSAGYDSADALLRPAPIVMNLLMVPAVLLLARVLLRDERAAWLAVLLFFAGNWYEQDYFAPQAAALLMAVSVIGLLLWLTSDPDGWGSLWRPARGRADLGRGSTIALEVANVLMAVAIVLTHQLTPVVLVLWLLVLQASGRLRHLSFGPAVAVLFAGWIVLGATSFSSRHSGDILGDLGRVPQILREALFARIDGDSAHLTMQYLRIGLCLLFLTAAVLAVSTSRLRAGDRLVAAGLAAAPFLLLALNSYGGEILLRAFLYSLPATAVLVAGLLARAAASRPRWPVLAAALAVAGFGLVVARGANQPFERVTPGDLGAAAYVRDRAGPDEIVAQFNRFTPYNPLWLRLDEDTPRHVITLDVDKCTDQIDPTECAVLLRPRWIIITTGQRAYAEIVEQAAPDWADVAVRRLEAVGYSVDFRSGGAIVLALPSHLSRR